MWSASNNKSKCSPGSEDTESFLGISEKNSHSTTLSMKPVWFSSMKEGYRSFPEARQPTSARTYLDLDKCQIKPKMRIKIKHALIIQKLKNTC